MAEPTAEKIQNLSLQGTDKEENSDYMNGINSPNEMENFDTNFEHSQLIKPTTNGDHTMAEESYPNDLPQTTDQLVPSSQDCDDTSQMSSQIQDSQEQSQILSGQDGVLVNVDGKENPQASNLPPGMHRYNPFLDPKEMESDSNNPFLSESATGQGDVDSSLSYDGGDQDGSSSAMDVSPVPESQTPDLLMGGVDSFQMEQSPINHGASVMEFDSSPSQNDPSLSQQSDKLSEVQRGNQDEENVQGDQSLSKKENIDNDEKAQLVIIKDIAQDDGLCDTESVTKDEEKSSQERKFSFDEQIVPGCCSCVEEPEPKPSQTPVIEEDSELDRGSGIKALEPESAEGNTNQENVRKTPEIRLQSEDDGFIDKEGNYDDDDIDEEDDEDYYDEGEESDEATPSDNFVVRQGTRAEEIPQHEVDAESDDYPDDDDEIYTDEEDIYDEEDGYRGSEEREGSSDYRESEEREMSQGDRGSLEKEGCEEYRDSMEKEYSPEYRGSLEREMSPGDRGNVENEVSQEYRDSIEKDVNQDYRDSVEKEISPDPRDSIEKEETLAPGYSIEKGVTPSPRDSIEKELSPGPKDSMGKGVSLGFRDSDRKEESPGLRDSIEKEVSPTPSDDIDREVSPDPRYGIGKEIFPGDNSFVVKESSPELDQREPGQADEDMKVEIECDSKMSTIDDRNISGEDTEMKEESMELNLEKDHMPRGDKVEQTNPFSSDVDVQNSSLHSYGEVDQITMKGPSENIDICQEVSSSSVKDTESNTDTVEMSDKVLTDKNIVQQSVEKYDDNEMNVSDNYVDKMEQNYDLIKEKMDEECLPVEEEQKRSYDNKEMDSATMQSVSDKDECSGKPQVQMGLNDFDSKEAIMGAENISLSAEQVAVDIREEPHEKIGSAKALDKDQSFSDMDNAKSGDIHGDDKNVSESVEYDKKDEMEVATAADEVDNQRIESFEEISNQFSEIHDRQKPVVLTNEGQMVLQFDGGESRKEVDSNVIDDQEVCGVYGKDDEDDIKPSKGILQKGDTFGIESEGSDMEERSITPDPDQHFKMNSHGPLPSDDQTISGVEHPEQKSESFMRDVDVLEDHMNEDGRLLSSNVDQDVMSSSVIDESSNTDQAVMSMSMVEDASENMDQDVMSRSVLKDESINVDKDVMLGSMIDIEPANMQEDVMSQSMIDESANVKQDLMTQSMIDESAKVGQDVMSQSVIDTSTNVDQDVMSQSVIDESANVDQDVMSQSMIDESANVDQNVMSQSMIDESANEDQDVMSSSVIDESADMVQDVMSQSMIDESANVDQNVMSQSMIDESTNVDQDVMSSSVFDESANVDQDLMSQSMIDESANVDQDVMSQSVIDESANVNQDIMSQSMIDESANVDQDVMSQSMIDESPNADLMSKSLEETSNDIMSVSMLDNGSGNNGQDLMSMSIIEQPVDIDQDIMSKSGVEDVTSSMPLDMMSQSMVMEDSMTEETGDKIDREAENDEQPFESKMSTSLMEGSMILDEGQCLDDIHPEEQNFEPSDQSPELHEAPKLLGSTMESSIILDEGQTFKDQIPDTNQMSRSIMEGSIVLDEGETFEDHKFDDNSASTVEDSNTPEGDSVSPVLNLPGISAMEGSIVLEKDEKLEDRFSENNMSKSMMGESIILGQGETFEDNIAFGSMEMSASYSESHPSLLSTELTASYTESCTESQTEESVQDLLKPASDASSQKLTSEEESYYQYEAAQNMVENVLNDAIDKVESMSKKSKTEEEEEKDEMVKEVEKEEKTDEDKKQEIISKEESMKDTKKEKNIQNTIVSSKDSKVHKTGVKDVTKGQEKPKEKERVKEKEKAKEKPKEKEKPKLRAPSASRDNRYSHITSRLTQETSASLSKKSTKKVADSKIPSPTKAETQKRSQSSSRRTRTPSRPAEARLSRPQEKKELSSESPSPKPSSALSASGGRTSASGMRRDKTPVQPRRETTSATRKSRPTQLMRPKKDVTPDTTAEEEKNPKRSASASSGKRYGIDAKNESYKPGGGKVKIFDQKVKVKASPRIDAGSKTPPSTNGSPRKESPRPKPTTPKGPSPNVKNVSSRIGSLDNAKYTPGGGKVKITTKKTDYSTVNSRVGSTANKDHKPGGGDKKIHSQRLDWKVESKIGSLDNHNHSPGGGNVKIVNERLSWSAKSRVGSMDNATYEPGGGNIKIESHKLEFKGKAQSKVGSTDNMSHKPGGGSRKIETQKLDFKEKAKPKIEAKTDHKPGGGDKKIETQKLNFKDTAKPRTDTGTSSKVRKESETSQDSAK